MCGNNLKYVCHTRNVWEAVSVCLECRMEHMVISVAQPMAPWLIAFIYTHLAAAVFNFVSLTYLCATAKVAGSV